MKHLFSSIVLTSISLVILIWGLYNILVPQYTYQGPTPIAVLVSFPLLYKAYKEYKLYKNMSI